MKLWLVNEGSGTERWPQQEVTVQSGNWRNWTVTYTPANFEDNEIRNLRIYAVGRNAEALIRTYEHINKFHRKTEPGGWGGIPALTEDMKPVSPTLPIRLAKTP